MALALLSLGRELRADTNTTLQMLNFSVFGTYEEINTNANAFTSPTNLLIFTNSASIRHTNRLVYSTMTNHTIKTIFFGAPNVVKAIAVDLNLFQGSTATDTNLSNALLYRKVTNGIESIVLRKAHARTNIEVDVTSFFGGPSAIANNFTTTGDLSTSVQSTNGIKTNLTVSLNSISFASSNLSFGLTNCYNTSFATTLGTNRVGNIMASGCGTFYVNVGTLFSSTNHLPSDAPYLATTPTTNTITVYSYSLINTVGTNNYYGVSSNTLLWDFVTNVAGPAHGTFSTTLGSLER